MRIARMSSAGVVGLVLLTGTTVPVAGEEATVTEDLLFEVVVPASAVPDPFRTLYFEAETIDPGTEGIIGVRNENMRGRTLYVDAGELVVEPMADALLWRGDATLGGDPTEVPAGESVRLATGDLILLPAIPPEELDPEAEIRIANPGPEITVSYGFHLCDGGGFGGWPEGISSIPPAGGISIPGSFLEPLASGDVRAKLMRMSMEPGTTVELDDDVLFRLCRLESGSVDASFVSKLDGDAGARRWKPGRGLPFAIATDWELRASPDDPAWILCLTGIDPSAE